MAASRKTGARFLYEATAGISRMTFSSTARWVPDCP